MDLYGLSVSRTTDRDFRVNQNHLSPFFYPSLVPPCRFQSRRSRGHFNRSPGATGQLVEQLNFTHSCRRPEGAKGTHGHLLETSRIF
jgi:hypothetical protein